MITKYDVNPLVLHPDSILVCTVRLLDVFTLQWRHHGAALRRYVPPFRGVLTEFDPEKVAGRFLIVYTIMPESGRKTRSFSKC